MKEKTTSEGKKSHNGTEDTVVNDTPIMGMTTSKFLKERKRKSRRERERIERETELQLLMIRNERARKGKEE